MQCEEGKYALRGEKECKFCEFREKSEELTPIAREVGLTEASFARARRCTSPCTRVKATRANMPPRVAPCAFPVSFERSEELTPIAKELELTEASFARVRLCAPPRTHVKAMRASTVLQTKKLECRGIQGACTVREANTLGPPAS